MTNNRIIDFHTHAFPDKVAANAVPALEKAGNVSSYTNGTCDGLIKSMDTAGIEKSVICSIATRVEQFQPILDWSNAVQSTRIIPLPSVHPDDPDLVAHVAAIKKEGFVGIKIHPYYQNFFLAEEKMDVLYTALLDNDLFVVSHTGFDIAYPRIRRADPEQVKTVLKKFPELRFVATHLGGWDDWQKVEQILIGQPVFLEISFALDFLAREDAHRMITSHPEDYLLFGTDSPWADQKKCLNQLYSLGLKDDLLKKMLWRNGAGIIYGTRRKRVE
jgi:predicted TIM-barrel fold metal-dependent hydrolase